MVSSQSILDFLIIDTIDESEESSDPRFYSYEFCSIIIPNLTDIQFHDHFRMSRETFFQVSQDLHSYTPETPRSFFDRRLLVFISFISHKLTYKHMSALFQIPPSTICDIILEMANFLFDVSPH